MATVNYSVAGGGDDGFESSGTVTLDGSFGLADATNEYIALVFRNVTIPDGATIDSAPLDPFIHSDSTDEPQTVIWAEDNATPADLSTSANDLSARTPTTAAVTWESADLGVPTSAGARLSSVATPPDLAPIFTELMASYSFAAGRTVCIIIRGGVTATRDCGIKFYESGAGNAANLSITYTEAAASGQPMMRRGEFIPFMRRRPHGIN